MRIAVVATLLIVGFVVFAVTDYLEAPLEVTAHNEGDELFIERDTNGNAVLHVRSLEGVGSATVKLTNKYLQTPIEVVLHLKSLEGLVVRSPGEVHRIGINSDGVVVLEPVDSRVLHMNGLQATENSGKFSVFINASDFAEPVCEFRLEWVDYYR